MLIWSNVRAKFARTSLQLSHLKEFFMRRVISSILTGTLLGLVGLGLWESQTGQRSLAQVSKIAKKKASAKPTLDGAWRLVSIKDPRTQRMRPLPGGIETIKLLVGGRYSWTVVQNGKAVGGAGGRYKVDGESYTEDVTYALGDNNQVMVGHSFDFTWKIENGKWHHMGTLKVGTAAQEVDELWEPAP
jgi:hypothetical protein